MNRHGMGAVCFDAGMTDWALLYDAYGPAREIPGPPNGTDDGWVWQELWGRFCHQGTVASASYAAIPELADVAARRTPACYPGPLHPATAIVASKERTR